MKIIIDDLTGGEVLALLEEHLSDMYATSVSYTHLTLPTILLV